VGENVVYVVEHVVGVVVVVVVCDEVDVDVAV